MKACKKKYDMTHSACKNCGMMVAVDEWQDHRSFCRDRAKRMIGANDAGAVPQHPNAPPTEYPENAERLETDIRIPCDFCGRKFNPDRVNKHMFICNKIRKKNKVKKRKVWDGGAKRVEGTVFAEFKDKRSKTPEIVKEWKKHGRRWRKERNMFREVMGAEEVKEVGPIKSLKVPKLKPGQVGNVLPTACDYKLPEDHVKTFVEKKKRKKERRTPRTSVNGSAGRSIKQAKASIIPKPAGPLREHTVPSHINLKEIAAVIKETKTVPKATTPPVIHSPRKETKKHQVSKSSSNSKVNINALRESKLLKVHNQQLRKKTGRVGPTVQKLPVDAGVPVVKYSTTMDEYRAREKKRRAQARRSRRR